MKSIYFLCILSIISFQMISAQTLHELVDQVSKDGISQMVNELSGEDSVTVFGTKVLIEHRVSNLGNNQAALYIQEKLESYGLTTEVINYSDSGRNIVAIQLGTENPEDIYLICGHYDSVAKHGADDNASGTTIVLETARILSKYNFKNTIIYALWDEEELGLIGAKNYAQTAKNHSKNILAVLNIDMAGYDSDNDNLYDIDVRNIADSYQIKDDLIDAVGIFNLNLHEKVVDPGTSASDHSAFWSEGYSAVLLGEAWSDDDVTPGYHSDNDRIGLFNIDYFWNMVKLSLGYIATKAEIITTSTNSVLENVAINIHPNPTSGKVIIEFESHIVGNLEITDILGKVLISERIKGTIQKIDLSEFVSANYLLRISEDKGKSKVIKIVKQ